jgi:tripartite-type tricarboxylate transporter receptor subunit TctC
VLVLVLSGLAGQSGAQQSWPTKPIRVIVPAPAGGLTDVVARTVTDRLTEELGQPLIVENRGGAGGTIGTAMVAKASPDGQTILIHSSSHTVAAAAFTHLPYDPIRDLLPVIPLGSTPSVLVVSSAKRYRTVHELVAAAKAGPRTLSFAGGPGSAGHLAAERFRLSAGFDAVHIPYRGAPQALPDVISGRVDFYFSPLLPALPLIADGQLTALAVSTSQRTSTLPDVPTIAEAGLLNAEYEFWNAIFVPAKTPAFIVDRLYKTTQKVLNAPDVQQKLAGFGTLPMPMSSIEFGELIKS